MHKKRVVMSKKEVALIILTIAGALALYGWQTYRMTQHMRALPVEQNASAASGTVQNK